MNMTYLMVICGRPVAARTVSLKQLLSLCLALAQAVRTDLHWGICHMPHADQVIQGRRQSAMLILKLQSKRPDLVMQAGYDVFYPGPAGNWLWLVCIILHRYAATERVGY